jgi:hypothetical protein
MFATGHVTIRSAPLRVGLFRLYWILDIGYWTLIWIDMICFITPSVGLGIGIGVGHG